MDLRTGVGSLPFSRAAHTFGAVIAGIASFASAAAAQPAVPDVTVVALDAQASEIGADTGNFFLTRVGGRIEQRLTVTVALSGTAVLGADYTAPALEVTFGPHVQMVNFLIKPSSDALREGPETVVLDIVPKPGSYTAADRKRATITIADAPGGATQGGSKPPPQGTPVEPPQAPPTAPPAEPGTPIGQRPPKDSGGKIVHAGKRFGTLHVTVSFQGRGHWSNARSGEYTTTFADRKIEYDVPLEGMYAFGSGFHEVDQREQKSPGGLLPLPNRYLVLRPRIGSAGTPCGRGTVSFKDVLRGMQVGDPGTKGLVPFVREISGGGNYPTGNETVPERDLCQTAVTIDFGKQVMHLRLDGTDTHVKVRDVHNGRLHGEYNRVLHGRDGGHAKKKLTFYDWPLPDRDAPEGYRVIENFIMEQGPENSTYPLTAKVQWKLTMDQHGY